MCACFANIIILIEFFVCCCKNEIILEECVCVPSRCRHHHCDCIWHIFFSFYLDCSPACINREHIAGWGVSFIRIPSNKNTHTHTRTHEMRLTLDKAFGTCLEFHPSQFYNRMKHKAWKEKRKKTAHHPYFFATDKVVFVFISFCCSCWSWCVLPKHFGGYYCMFRTAWQQQQQQRYVFICFLNGKCARLTSTSRTTSKWDLYFLEWITKNCACVFLPNPYTWAPFCRQFYSPSCTYRVGR